jgi:hypothetical protein
LFTGIVKVMEPLVAEYLMVVKLNREGSKEAARIANGCDCIFICKLLGSRIVSLMKSENVFSTIQFVNARRETCLFWNLDSAFGRDARDENNFDPRFNGYHLYFSDDVTYDSK